ncbi:response regulator transcription factor [Nocardia sp. NPDC004860]|uniref:response regulator transcription factor n=1 Tax=Nocardia sp. NPDC004860 TaxID=3154557 RepID=UPI0033AF351F
METSESAGSSIRRIGVIEDHPVLVEGLRAILSVRPELQIVAAAKTVPELLEITTDLELAVLDLHGLPDGSMPKDNVNTLREAGINNVVVYTIGESRDLVQAAAQAGVLGVICKDEPAEVVVEAIAKGIDGDLVGSIDWAAAIDADEKAWPKFSEREKEVLSLYAAGLRMRDIAAMLGIAQETVNTHLKSIRSKYAAMNLGTTKWDIAEHMKAQQALPTPPWRRTK